MPTRGCEEVRLNRDDVRARRLASLALLLMGSDEPLASSRIHEEVYASLGQESFNRSFSRDRETLAACGLNVVRAGSAPRSGTLEALWAADPASFCDERDAPLPVDALTVDIACRSLLDEPEFPLSDELAHALAKVNRAFGDTTLAADAARRSWDRTLHTLRACHERGHAAGVRYVNAQGVESRRTLAPYGFYGLRERLYLVAADLGQVARMDGGPADQASPEGETPQALTFRVDRVLEAHELGDVPYSVPEGFDVDEYCRLPFQLGETCCVGTLWVPPERAGELRHASMRKGSLRTEGDGLVWEVPISSVGAAASWAIAQGLRPLAPDELVSAWHAALEGVLRHA